MENENPSSPNSAISVVSVPRHNTAVNVVSLVIGISSILCWLALFTFGISVGTTTYMRVLDPDNAQNQVPTWAQAVEIWQLNQGSGMPVLPPEILAPLSRDEVAQIITTFKADEKSERTVVAKQPIELSDRAKRMAEFDPPKEGSNQNGASAPGKESPKVSAHAGEANTAPSLKFPLGQSPTSVDGAEHQVKFAHGGLYIPAKPKYPTSLQSWLGVFFCNTIINLGLLSCLASLIGSLYYAARHQIDPKFNPKGELLFKGPMFYLAGLVQGFVMYLAVLAGLLALGEVPVESVTTSKYTHLAGVLSVLSFWAGYTPGEFFSNLLNMKVKSATGASANA